jgi:hypothetical protein
MVDGEDKLTALDVAPPQLGHLVATWMLLRIYIDLGRLGRTDLGFVKYCWSMHWTRLIVYGLIYITS